MRDKMLDLQGLRFLAVGLVVAYHLSPNRISGGYVGVDVFFVISGFLITGHLLKEADATGTISLTRFWARRIRRLLPAAFIVLAACTVAAILILPRSNTQQSLREIGAAAVYSENWLLAGNAVDYLASTNAPSLVQHFWSLSTEEQFYVVWPLLLLGVAFACRRRSRRTRRAAMGAALAIVAGGSLAFSIYETATSPAAAYFVTTTRAWEFAAGGLVAFAPGWPTVRSRLLQGLRLVVAWLGVTLIIGSAFVLTGSTPFPGAVALLPVLGTVAIIFTRENESGWSPSYLFRAAPVQWIGDLSYAIYLWHWPLIVLFPTITGHALSTRGRVLIVAVTIGLAVLTKRLVEDPIRVATGWTRRRIPAYAFMAVGALLLVTVSGGTNQAYAQEARVESLNLALAIEQGSGCIGAAAMVASNHCSRPYAVTGHAEPGFAALDTDYNFGVLKGSDCGSWDHKLVACTFGAKHASVHIALVGDSHAQYLASPLSAYAKTHGWEITLYSYAGCSGLEAAAAGADDWCAEYGSWARRQITRDSTIDAVVFSNKSRAYSTDPTAALRFWDTLLKQGKKVIAVKDSPGMPDETRGPDCVSQHLHEYDPCAWRPGATDDFMQQAVAFEKGRIPVVDLTTYLCTDGTCHTVIGGLIVYFDDNHLTYTFAQTLSPLIGREIQRNLVGVEPA